MAISLFKTIKEGDTMLDLVVNIKKNIKFYINHREDLADIHFSNERLYEYYEKMNRIEEMYDNNTIPKAFKNYKASLFLSADFPYINSYLSFCFSFEDFVNIVLSLGKTYVNGGKKYVFNDIEYIDAGKIIPMFYCESNKIELNTSYNKEEFMNFLKKLN